MANKYSYNIHTYIYTQSYAILLINEKMRKRRVNLEPQESCQDMLQEATNIPKDFATFSSVFVRRPPFERIKKKNPQYFSILFQPSTKFSSGVRLSYKS